MYFPYTKRSDMHVFQLCLKVLIELGLPHQFTLATKASALECKKEIVYI